MSATKTKSKGTRKSKRKAERKLLIRKLRLRGVRDIESDLRRLSSKLEDAAPTMKDAAKLDALRSELDLTLINELPPPPGIVEPLKAMAELPVAEIHLNGNHREETDAKHDPALHSLARTIQLAGGLIQPIGVHQLSPSKRVLIWGSRRLRAFKLLGWKMITARVYPAETTPEQIEILRSIENLNHLNLTPAETAVAVARVLETIEKGMKKEPLLSAVEEAGGVFNYAAIVLGRPVKFIRDHSYAHKLTGAARALLSARRIDIAHARELAKLGDAAAVDELALAVARTPDGLGGRDVEHLRGLIQSRLRSLAKVPWRLNVEMPEAKDRARGCEGWACDSCPFNTKADPVLFHDDLSSAIMNESEAGTCTNAPCYEVKMEAADKIMAKAVRAAVRAVNKGDEIKATENSLAPFIPVTIRGNVFVREVKKAIAEKSGGEEESESAAPAADAAAKTEYMEQLGKWKKKAAQAISAAIAKDPIRLAYFTLLRHAQKFEPLRQRGPFAFSGKDMEAATIKMDAKAEKLAGAPGTEEMIKKMSHPYPTEKLIAEIGAELKSPDDFELAQLQPGALIRMANHLEQTLTDPPPLPED